MKRFMIMLVSAILLLSGCAGAAPAEDKPVSLPEETAETAAAVEGEEIVLFTDDLGRNVELPKEITAVVPSGSISQMFLFSIAPETAVGLGSKWKKNYAEYTAWEGADLPYFGQLYSSADLNVEELAAVNPQVIIDIGEAKKSTGEDLDALTEQTGIPTIFLNADLEHTPDAFRRLGELLNRREKGEELAAFCQEIYEQTMETAEKVRDHRVQVLYVLGEEGLNVMAKGSYHAELIDLLCDNTAVVENPSSKGLGNEVDLEQIAVWNPETILFAPGSIYADVQERDTWNKMDAIADGRYAEVPEGPYNYLGNPPGVQRYLGMIWLPALLYPEDCSYDMKEEIHRYYELFYGKALSEEQYEELMAHAVWH